MIKYLMAAILSVGTTFTAAEVMPYDVEIDGVIYTPEEQKQLSIFMGYLTAEGLMYENLEGGMIPGSGPLADQTGKTALAGYDFFIMNKEKFASGVKVDVPIMVTEEQVRDFQIGMLFAMRHIDGMKHVPEVPLDLMIIRKSIEDGLNGVPMPPISKKYKKDIDEVFEEMPGLELEIHYIEEGEK